jgi:hypothetical protein
MIQVDVKLVLHKISDNRPELGVNSVGKKWSVVWKLELILDRGSPMYRNLAPRGSKTRTFGTLGPSVTDTFVAVSL